MSLKKTARLRRARKTRGKIRRLASLPRLTVFRSNQHIYVQVFTADGATVLASASSSEKDFSREGSGKDVASRVGKLIADRAKTAGVEKVAFDRSGFKYHGRVQSLADAAREGGMDF